MPIYQFCWACHHKRYTLLIIININMTNIDKIKNIKSNDIKINWSRGFTLIELMVSTSLYSIIAITLISILLLVSGTNQRLRKNEHAINNLMIAVENIKRDAKLGSNFRCDNRDVAIGAADFILDGAGSGSIVSRDCILDISNAINNGPTKGGDTRLTFRVDTDRFVSYYMGDDPDGGTGKYIIRKTYSPIGNLISTAKITTNDIDIQALHFYLEGSSQIDNTQPSIIVKAKGVNAHNDGRGSIGRVFQIETAVTPIGLDG